MTRRRAVRSGLLAALAPLGTACARPQLTTALRPPASPRDHAVTFQALLPGQVAPPLDAPESAWYALAESPSTVSQMGGELAIVSVPGRRAFVTPRLPVAPAEPLVSGQHEDLTWTTTLTLEARQQFFVVCELRFAGEPGAVLVQATPTDTQISQDSERPGGATSVSRSVRTADGRPQHWRLRLTETRGELLLNGSPLWALEGRKALGTVSFGETRTDALHGGQMRLRDVVYVRRPALAHEK
jgi:hypothetical protein